MKESEVQTGTQKLGDSNWKYYLVFIHKTALFLFLTFIFRGDDCVKQTWTYQIQPGRDDLILQGDHKTLKLHNVQLQVQPNQTVIFTHFTDVCDIFVSVRFIKSLLIRFVLLIICSFTDKSLKFAIKTNIFNILKTFQH